MSHEVVIRRLLPADATAFASLRREALEREPLAFGAFEGTRLSGVVGIFREPRAKQRHKATIWGVYVTASAREKGVGGALLAATIRHARRWPGLRQVHLSVAETAVAAKRMHETAGFRSWGREPRALQWQGEFVDDFHLVLGLGVVVGEGTAEPAPGQGA